MARQLLLEHYTVREQDVSRLDNLLLLAQFVDTAKNAWSLSEDDHTRLVNLTKCTATVGYSSIV